MRDYIFSECSELPSLPVDPFHMYVSTRDSKNGVFRVGKSCRQASMKAYEQLRTESEMFHAAYFVMQEVQYSRSDIFCVFGAPVGSEPTRSIKISIASTHY